MKNSRRKGKSGELEVATELRRIGFADARRGVQYAGGPDSPDVVGIPGLHLEIKRTEKLILYSAMSQASDEAAVGEVPVLVHRRSRRPWLAVVQLDHAVPFACRLLRGLGYRVLLPGLGLSADGQGAGRSER